MQVTNMDKKRVEFSLSILLFWVKGSIEVDNRTINTSTQNVIMGAIPAGRDDQVFRLNNVQGTSVSQSYRMAQFVLGAILALVGFVMLDGNLFAGLVLTVIGIVTFLNGILTSLTIQGNGSNYIISVPFFEKAKIQEINAAINEALIYREDASDNNRVMANANQNTAAMVDAIRSQNAAQATVQTARKFCSTCGAANAGAAAFCSSCGAQT